MRPRILIVDDHEIVREGVRGLIRRSRPEWEISGEATNGQDAIEAVKKLRPDIVVLDKRRSRPLHFDLDPRPRILMFTMHESDRLSTEVRQAKAQGYVLKSQAARNLIRAIERLLMGGEFFGPEPGPGQLGGPPEKMSMTS